MSEVIGGAILIMACGLALIGWQNEKEKNDNNKETEMMNGKQVSGEVALQMVSAMSKVADAADELKEARKTLDDAMIEADSADDCFCLIGMSDYILRAHTALTNVLFHMPTVKLPKAPANYIAIDEVMRKIEAAKGGGGMEQITLIAEHGTASLKPNLKQIVRKHCTASTARHHRTEVAA